MSASISDVDKWDVSEVKTEKFTYQWTIKNFNSLCMQPEEKLESPVFSFKLKKEIKWFIRLHSQGDRKENKDYLSLFLCWNIDSSIKGYFHLWLVDDERENVTKKVEFSSRTKSDGLGYPFYIQRNRLFDKAKNMLPNDCLTIKCKIIIMSEVNPIIEHKKQKISPGSSWLGNLFLEEDFSDVKIIGNSTGNSLPAHKCILAACSPVFEAMFKNKMLEQKLGVVKLKSEKYEVIKEMLRFIYLGKVENESITSELLKLAHKYQITDLVELCGEILSKQISTDNALAMIALDDLYKIDDLKATATKFAKTYINDIIKSKDFKSSKNSQTLQSVLEAFAEQ